MYVAGRTLSDRESARQIGKLLDLFEIAPIDKVVLRSALSLGFKDFEDAVLCAAAIAVGAEVIVTRDHTRFERAPLPAVSPADLLAVLRAS